MKLSNDTTGLIAEIEMKLLGKELSVLLAGSFSRGEETAVIKKGGGEYVSDIEFIIFQGNFSYFIKRWHMEIAAAILEVSEDFKINIDYAIKPLFSTNFIPKTFFWYETLESCHYLNAKDDLHLGKLSLNDVCDGDVLEVLNHSVISLLKRVVFEGENGMMDDSFKYAVIKAGLDLLIPLLKTRGLLVATHKARYENVREFLFDGDDFFRINKGYFDLMYSMKLKSRVYRADYLDEFSVSFLLESYIGFSNYVYLNVKRYCESNACEIGDRSFMRRLYLCKKAISNPSKAGFILSPKTPEALYHMNLESLVNMKKRHDDKSQEYCNISEPQGFFEDNKLIYRYL